MGGERHRHVVSSEDGSEEEDVCQGGESVFGRVMWGHVDDRVDISLYGI